jgi:hypothetical protein
MGQRQTEKIEIDELSACGWRVFAVTRYNHKFAVKLTKCCGRSFLSLALLSPMLLSGAPVVAQVAGAASPALHTQHSHRQSNIDDRVKVFAKNLDLNEAQQSAVKKILEQRQKETLQLRLDPSISGDARIDRFRAIQDNTVKRIRAVLNEEQRKNYDPLAARRIQQPDQRSVEDWLKATTPK